MLELAQWFPRGLFFFIPKVLLNSRILAELQSGNTLFPFVGEEVHSQVVSKFYQPLFQMCLLCSSKVGYKVPVNICEHKSECFLFCCTSELILSVCLCQSQLPH